MAMGSLEMRVPFVDRIQMAIPPISFYGIRGALFLDAGAAWSDNRSFQAFQDSPGLLRLKDLRAGMGTGVRMLVSPFAMKLDFAWKTDLASVYDKVRVTFVLGSDF
jgi:outer membrane protein assembly factor BamA